MLLPSFAELYKKRYPTTFDITQTFINTITLNLHTAKWCNEQHGYLFNSYGYVILDEDITYMSYRMKPYGYRVEVSSTIRDEAGGKYVVVIPII